MTTGSRPTLPAIISHRQNSPQLRDRFNTLPPNEREGATLDQGEPLSYRDLRDLTGQYKNGPVGKSTISNWVRGEVRGFRRDRLEIAARAWAAPDYPEDQLRADMLTAAGLLVETSKSVIDIPELAELAARDVTLVEEFVRALARAERRGYDRGYVDGTEAKKPAVKQGERRAAGPLGPRRTT